MNANDALLINESTSIPQLCVPNEEEGDIKKRYSIEMFEDLIQTVAKMKLQLSQL